MQFALGKHATLSVGDYVYGTNTVVLAEQASASVATCSSASTWRSRIPIFIRSIRPAPPMRSPVRRPGGSAAAPDSDRAGGDRGRRVDRPNSTILKGVRIRAGAFIEPGSVVTRDVPPRARVLGNPAQIVGEV
jgi:hypothetical protein